MRSSRAILALGAALVGAVDLDITSSSSIKSAASTIAYGTMKYYTGNNTGDNPGNVPSPYYWWEGGGLFGTMVEYWYYTGDTTYNDVVEQAIISQIGDDDNFMPQNQTKDEGNDDQGFWGMTAMTAAETNFQAPASGQPGWLALAQGTFNTMSARWDTTSCGGGLKWQIYTFNSGYDYKNSIANGALFNLAARLARYTGNSTYADWANKIWDWEISVGLIDSSTYAVYDGTSDTENCTSIDRLQFTYNQGVYLFGAAMMYNYTNGSSTWQTRTQGILNGTSIFFKNGIMYEESCEDVTSTANPQGTCDTDQLSFKTYLARWMAASTKIAPFTYDYTMALLKTSATAAAAQCDGGSNGQTCGEHWTANATYDGTYGLGQQMCALSVVQSLLIDDAVELVTNSTGGTSVGDYTAGTGSSSTSTDGESSKPVTGGDRAGAGILTAVVLCGCLAGIAFMVTGV